MSISIWVEELNFNSLAFQTFFDLFEQWETFHDNHKVNVEALHNAHGGMVSLFPDPTMSVEYDSGVFGHSLGLILAVLMAFFFCKNA